MLSLRRWHHHVAGRVAVTAVLLVVTMQIYWFLNRTLPPRFDLLTPLDDAIPFLPWTMLVYLSLYAMVLAAAFLCAPEEYPRLMAAVLLANLCCYAGFALFTAHYPRPDVAGVPAPWHAMFAAIFASDLPGNTFPSIHVATPVLVAVQMRKTRRAVVWALWAAAIALSTLTVKQHFVVDVAGGVLVAVAVAFVALRFGRRS